VRKGHLLARISAREQVAQRAEAEAKLADPTGDTQDDS
jgi:hypothetical protein